MFTKPKYTNAGKELQARALSGACKIIFTSVGLGAGELTTQAIAALTDLIQPVKRIDINTIEKISTDTVQMKATLRNIELTTGFFWREFGLFAQDPDNPDDRTKDILFCYQNAGDLAEYIPTASEQLLDRVIYLGVTTGDADRVEINFNEKIFCLQEEFLEHCADPNAHSDLFAGVVHLTGDETIEGTKTFKSTISGNITGNADTATHATTADTATEATHATSADTATEATHATSADTATKATVSSNSEALLTENGSRILQDDSNSFYAYDNNRKAFVWNSTGGTAEFYGTATKATKFSNAIDVKIADNDGSNIGPSASMDGSTNVIVNLPSTIKANITGNAETATTATNCPNYLPLSGGYLTSFFIGRDVDNSYLHLSGCTDYIKGAMLIMYGEGSSDFAGSFRLIARNSSNSYELVGNLNGELLWGGKHIVRSVNGVTADQNGNVYINSVPISNGILTENGSRILQDDSNSFYAYDNIRKATVWNSTGGYAYFYGQADKAVQDSDGNPINTTYFKGSSQWYVVGSTIFAITGTPLGYGETTAGSNLKYAALDSDGGIYDLNSSINATGTWVKVSGNSGNTNGFGLYRRIA